MTEMTQVTHLLIDRAGQGDESARHELLERYRDYLRRMVSARLDRRIVPRVDASDVVQDTLAEAARRLDVYLERPPHPLLRLAAAHRGGMRDPDAPQARRLAQAERRPGKPDARDHRRLAVGLVRSLVANDTSPSNKLAHQELIDQLTSALAASRPVTARSW